MLKAALCIPCVPPDPPQHTGANQKGTVDVLRTGQARIYPQAPTKHCHRGGSFGNPLGSLPEGDATGQVLLPWETTGARAYSPPYQAVAHSYCPLPDAHRRIDSHHTHTLYTVTSHTHQSLLTHRTHTQHSRLTHTQHTFTLHSHLTLTPHTVTTHSHLIHTPQSPYTPHTHLTCTS